MNGPRFAPNFPMRKNAYTPTQARLLAILLDGQPHTLRELMVCLRVRSRSRVAVSVHLSAMRRVLRGLDYDIVSRRCHGIYYYQLVQLSGTFPTVS